MKKNDTKVRLLQRGQRQDSKHTRKIIKGKTYGVRQRQKSLGTRKDSFPL